MMSCCNDVIEDVHQIHDAHTSLADIEIFHINTGSKLYITVQHMICSQSRR